MARISAVHARHQHPNPASYGTGAQIVTLFWLAAAEPVRDVQ
jgi:hypothetical protein